MTDEDRLEALKPNVEDYLEALERREPVQRREYIINCIIDGCISVVSVVVPACLTAWICWILLCATVRFFFF